LPEVTNRKKISLLYYGCYHGKYGINIYIFNKTRETSKCGVGAQLHKIGRVKELIFGSSIAHGNSHQK